MYSNQDISKQCRTCRNGQIKDERSYSQTVTMNVFKGIMHISDDTLFLKWIIWFFQPFPVSYQKGWKIHSFIHGHRVWFHFLTFTSSSSTSPTTSNPSGSIPAGSTSSAPCIKVFATFDRVRASAQVSSVETGPLSCEFVTIGSRVATNPCF